MSEYVTSYYPNSLCLKDKSKAIISSNWFGEQFDIPYISIESCNNKTYSGTCKTEEEIDQFMLDNKFYFGGQETLVNKNLYGYSDDIDHSFSDPDNELHYFPLIKKYKSLFIGSSELKGHDKNLVSVELMYGLDEIEIDDHYIQIDDITNRERDFANLKNIRDYKESKEWFIDNDL